MAAQSTQATSPEASRWQELLSAGDLRSFGDAWLTLLGERIPGADAGLLVRLRAGEIETVAVRGESENRLLEAATEALREDRVFAQPGNEDGARTIIAHPLRERGRPCGAAAMALRDVGEQALPVALRELQWGIPWAEARLREATWSERVGREGSLLVLQLVGAALAEQGFEAAAQALVSEIARLLHCDRVSLGLRRGGEVRVAALSHSAEFGHRMNLVRALGEAMDEAIDQGRTLVVPAPDDEAPMLQAHRKLAREHGAEPIWTIPMQIGAESFGALLVEGASAEDPAASLEACETAAAILAPALQLQLRDARSLPRTLLDAGRDELGRWLGPRHLGRKLAASIALLLLLLAVLVTGEYRVNADATLEGEVRRVVIAPFDGYVAAAEKRAGDLVEEGDLLARLDDRDLTLERLKWQSRRLQLRRQRDDARASRERSALAVAQAQIDEADAELGRIGERLERTRITAPFDGMLVSGDLSQSLGAAVGRGDVLFELTPQIGWRVVLLVDESQINDIQVGQQGSLVLVAVPGGALPLRVTRITPVAQAEEGENRFRVDAELEQNDDRLRPGLTGVGKISIDERRLVWIWSRSLLNWLRLALWSIWP